MVGKSYQIPPVDHHCRRIKFNFTGIPSGRRDHCSCCIGPYLYIFGGVNANSVNYKDLWRYDTRTQDWERMLVRDYANIGPSCRIGATMCVREVADHQQQQGEQGVLDYELILFGGMDGEYEYSEDIWVFHTFKRRWRKIIPKGSIKRCFHGAFFHRKTDSLVVVGGSDENDELTNEIWSFGFKERVWKLLESDSFDIPEPRDHHRVSLVSNDKFVMIGGERNFGETDEIWEFDVSTHEWNQVFSFDYPLERSSHAICRFSNFLLLYGGTKTENNEEVYDKSVYCLDLSNDEWHSLEISNFHEGRSGHTMDIVYNTEQKKFKIYIFGGETKSGICNSDILEITLSHKEILNEDTVNDNVDLTLSSFGIDEELHDQILFREGLPTFSSDSSVSILTTVNDAPLIKPAPYFQN